jgi:hypothetical protein
MRQNLLAIEHSTSAEYKLLLSIIIFTMAVTSASILDENSTACLISARGQPLSSSSVIHVVLLYR